MLFSEPAFLFLLLPLALLSMALPRQTTRNLALVGLSLLFYFLGEGKYVALMLACCGWNYVLAIGIASRTEGSRKLLLGLGVAFNLGVLAWFKYAGFLASSLNSALHAVGLEMQAPVPQVHLPIGISFFIFQAISYLVDVHRDRVKAIKDPVGVTLYISLFPQLIAGPIVRLTDIVGQLYQRRLTTDNFSEGVVRFIRGLAKKMLIANTLAESADAIFGLPESSLTLGLAWFGVVCYGLQIYFDFSGYSDMAIGIGKMLGFEFPENFRHPYSARSITEFWRRWHISLSSWFRDYLYIPLGGNRGGEWRTYRNLLIVFFLCGLWHGASWNFVIWGLIHGFFLIVERRLDGFGSEASSGWWRRPYVALVVLFSWVFFRAETLPDSLGYVGTMIGSNGISLAGVGSYLDSITMIALIIGLTFAFPLRERLETWLDARATGQTILVRTSVGGAQIAVYSLALLGSIAQSAAGTYNPFIYFRF